MKVLLLASVFIVGQDKHLDRQTFDAYPFFYRFIDLKNMINDS